MSVKYLITAIVCLWRHIVSADAPEGVLLLYRPRDITNDCAHSHALRYDVSFGMGVSDTVTLVFRTMNQVDYECSIEITTDPSVVLIIVIKFPNSMWSNCVWNKNAFTIISKENGCMELCSMVDRRSLVSSYFVEVVRGSFRFRFASNSSINNHISAHSYQVTATAARLIGNEYDCMKRNETVCIVNNLKLCFTSGTYCDGIKNCGVFDCESESCHICSDDNMISDHPKRKCGCEFMYDERRACCGLPVEKLGTTAVVAVVAALCLAVLAGCRLVIQCLPAQAHSFFLFNANEDNRLCINVKLRPPQQPSTETVEIKRQSVIPIDTSSSSGDCEDRKFSSNAELLKTRSEPKVKTIDKSDMAKERVTSIWRTGAIEKLRARFQSLTRSARSTLANIDVSRDRSKLDVTSKL